MVVFRNLTLDNLEGEIWKDIPNYEGLYQVSNLGRIKSLCRNIGRNRISNLIKILLMKKDKDGYLSIKLSKNNNKKYFRVHRIVLLAFKGASNLEVNHINGIKSDNRLENLEYCTKSENELHAYKIGLKENVRIVQKKLIKQNFKNYYEKRKVQVLQYSKDNKYIQKFNSIKDAYLETNTRQSDISSCINYPNKHKSAGGYIWRKVNV